MSEAIVCRQARDIKRLMKWFVLKSEHTNGFIISAFAEREPSYQILLGLSDRALASSTINSWNQLSGTTETDNRLQYHMNRQILCPNEWCTHATNNTLPSVITTHVLVKSNVPKHCRRRVSHDNDFVVCMFVFSQTVFDNKCLREIKSKIISRLWSE